MIDSFIRLGKPHRTAWHLFQEDFAKKVSREQSQDDPEGFTWMHKAKAAFAALTPEEKDALAEDAKRGDESLPQLEVERSR